MRPGDVVASRRHKGLIRLVVVYRNGSDIVAVRQPLPGCGA